MKTTIYTPMQIAFLRQLIQTEHGYEWPKPKSKNCPYGQIIWTEDSCEKRSYAHRVAWILENGPIPEGYEIDHDPECPKTCVTVEHLQMLSKTEHTKLGWERGELNGGWGTVRERKYEPGFMSDGKDGIKPIPKPFAWQYERPCPWCNISFIPKTGRQKFCSSICKNRSKEKARLAIRYPKSPPKPCEWCGEEFQPKRSDSNHCSNECIFENSYEKRRANKLGKPNPLIPVYKPNPWTPPKSL